MGFEEVNMLCVLFCALFGSVVRQHSMITCTKQSLLGLLWPIVWALMGRCYVRPSKVHLRPFHRGAPLAWQGACGVHIWHLGKKVIGKTGIRDTRWRISVRNSIEHCVACPYSALTEGFVDMQNSSSQLAGDSA